MTKNMRYTGASDCSEYQPSSGRLPHSSGPGEGQIFTGLPKSARMAKRREFLAVTDRANPPDLKFSAGCFLLLGRENGLGRNRLGVTVTKKTASRAVDRNRIKRIVREFFRHNNYQWPSGFDFVFIAKRGAAEAENRDLRFGLEKIGRKLADRKTAEPEDDRPETDPAPEPAGYSGPGEKPEKPWPVQAFLAIADFFEWLLKGLALGLIYIYQRLISPLLPPSCRFRPTCSRYAVQAIIIHGFWRGAYLTVRRLLKCHPFHPGGYDPVPPKKTGT